MVLTGFSVEKIWGCNCSVLTVHTLKPHMGALVLIPHWLVTNL